VSKARQELVESWQLLKDAAGAAFVPGYKQQAAAAAAAAAAAKRRQPLRYSSLLQDSEQQPQRQPQADVVSIPDRLQRILTGQFIREREAASSSNSSAQQQQQQQVNPQFAAVQFEILQRMKKQQQQEVQQPQRQQQQEAADKTAPVAAAAEAADAEASAAASAAVSVGPDGIIDVTPDIAQPQAAAAAAEQQADNSQSATSDAAAAAAEAVAQQSGFYPASTQVLVVCTWAVFLLQWAQALPALWGVVTGGGLLDAAAALLLAFPDTAVTHSMCLVSECDTTDCCLGTHHVGLPLASWQHQLLLRALCSIKRSCCQHAAVPSTLCISRLPVAAAGAFAGHDSSAARHRLVRPDHIRAVQQRLCCYLAVLCSAVQLWRVSGMPWCNTVLVSVCYGVPFYPADCRCAAGGCIRLRYKQKRSGQSTPV
jgi:hypothetical protein